MADGFHAFAEGPTPDELAAFDLNDYGNALRLIRLIGGRIEADGSIDISAATLLYLLGQGWIGFNGKVWDRKLGDQLASRAAHQVAVKVRGLHSALVARGLTPKDAVGFMNSCGNRGAISAMKELASAYLTVEIDAFDRDPMALNCRNGTLKLRLGEAAPDCERELIRELRPHDPADRITRLIDVDYDPDATADLFRQTVEASLPDPEVRAFFQRAHGYSATGAVHEQALFICQGLGRDGKSTILDGLRETLGSYGAVGKVETFLDIGHGRSGGEAAPDIVELAGDVRMIVLSEPPRGSKLAEGLLKAWTSGSPISARQLREKPFTFRPIGKLWMECNAFPVARGDDDGVWRRIHPVLFENQVPVEAMDRMLPVKLRAERAGMLNWLIEGVGDWLRRGLDPPHRVRQALDDYRKQSSPFGDWLNERCVWGKAANGTRTISSELYADYKDWAEGQGHDKPMSQRAFGDALHQRQIMLAGKDAKGRKFRAPIRLKTAFELAEDLERANASFTGSGAGGQSGPGTLAATFPADDEGSAFQ